MTETSLREVVDDIPFEILGELVIAQNEMLTTVDLTSLQRVGGRIVIVRNRQLEELDLPRLAGAKNIIIFDNAPGVTCAKLLGTDICKGEDADADCECHDDASPVDAGF